MGSTEIEEESIGTAEYLAFAIFSCLGVGFIISVIVVATQVAKHRKKVNDKTFKSIKAAEAAEAERLQKKEDEALAKAL